MNTELLPGVELAAGKMPGNWLLARLGKRVLRPGGLELSRSMLRSMLIQKRNSHHDDGPPFEPASTLEMNWR